MRLSDIMSQMGLSSYAEAGLLLFFLTFTVIAVRLFLCSNSDDLERAKRLPLNDHSFPTSSTTASPKEDSK